MSANRPSAIEKAVWSHAKDLNEFRPETLLKYGIKSSTAKKFIGYWQTRGWTVITRTDENKRRFYCEAELAKKLPQLVSAEPTAEGNMWRAIRILRTFTPTDVAAHANAGGVEVTVPKARSYCQKLLSVDYLRVRSTAIPGQREAQYSLVENSGPHAPVSARVHGLLDPNKGKFFPADSRVRE
jgi:hypothetical protein